MEETIPAVELIVAFLGEPGFAHIDWYLDKPVSNSGRLKAIIADSYLDGFRLVILLAAAMSLLGGVTAWILIDGKSGKAPAAAAA